MTLENEGSWRLATGEAISHPAEIMGRPARWMHGLTGRAPMKSPGKPSLWRDVERQFWCEIANKTAETCPKLAASKFTETVDL